MRSTAIGEGEIVEAPVPSRNGLVEKRKDGKREGKLSF
jgi:hypothetical protein